VIGFTPRRCSSIAQISTRTRLLLPFLASRRLKVFERGAILATALGGSALNAATTEIDDADDAIRNSDHLSRDDGVWPKQRSARTNR
jgi:hypothetical protein